MAKKTKKKTARAVKKTGTAVAIHNPRQQAVAAPATFLDLLWQASTNKNVDVEKMRAMLEMRAQEEARNARSMFDTEMALLQPELPTIKKNGLIVIKDKNDSTKIIQSTPYARWEDIHRVIMPALHRHGFTLTHRNGRTPEGLVFVKSVLSHGHHREETEIALQVDATGSKNNTQGVGSAITYGIRYNTRSLLNLLFEGDDDDGAAAGGKITPQQPGTISQDQITLLRKRAAETKNPISRVLDYASRVVGHKIETDAELPAAIFEQVMQTLSENRQ